MAEESHSVGVLGKHGRGITEHYGVPVSSIEIISGSSGHAIGGAGGFSVGPKEATVHQRLSSNGYCFSCSLPPFVAAAGTKAFERIEQGADVARLQTRIKELNKALKQNISSLVVQASDLTPMAHLRLPQSTGKRLEDEKLLQEIVDAARAKKILVTRSHYVFAERNAPAPSIRIAISQKHTAADLSRATQIIEEVAAPILNAAFPESASTSTSSKGKKKASPAAPKSPRGSKASNKLTIKDEEDDEDDSGDVEEIIQAPSSPKARGSSRSKKSAAAPTSPKASAAKGKKKK